jgi:hypothetical protein
MNNTSRELRHILLSNTSYKEKFTTPPKKVEDKFRLPERDRQLHSQRLKGQLMQADRDLKKIKPERKAEGIDKKIGITLTFQSEPGFELKFESLDVVRSGIELLSVKESNGKTYASVYIPDGKLKYFIKKLEKYETKDTLKGKPKNKKLVESISEIKKTGLNQLWTDDQELFPSEGENIWWEVWLRAGKDEDDNLNIFLVHAPLLGLKLKDETIRFPDRVVILAYGSLEQMTRSLELLSCISEVRRAKDNPDFFMGLPVDEQRMWVNEALDRIEPAPLDNISICILDTGIASEHPLIRPHLSEKDLHAYQKDWSVYDQDGHGTGMAGLALYGDNVELLGTNESVRIPFRLESAKILPPHGNNEPELYGAITSECISRAEIEAPTRKRILSMAVTTPDNRDRGMPSSWSAKVDGICSGADDEHKRLMVLSAGNTDGSQRHLYPESNMTESIHDPGQSWNALCVGAYTKKVIVDQSEYPGWTPIAPSGDLSPSSTTSMVWKDEWPIKPDIVFEGGNNALDPSTKKADYGPDSLGLLTTHNRPTERLFTVSGDTSAAASQVARMAAVIQSDYPELWPETIRALLVHSAEWTPQMLKRFGPLRIKKHWQNLIRCCGFGVPNLKRALFSARNALTLIVQDKLYPFEKKESRCSTLEMHLHKIPWPKEELADLGQTDVEMRVTLSYFIEPNPARRGWKNKYRYASHQLRFDVKTPTETIEQFRKRINQAAREKGESTRTSSDSGSWLLGSQLRHKGSLHSDVWKGSAIDLSQRGYIAVYPVSGWWKERHQLERYDSEARYSMLIDISTPGTDVDIYTAITNKIGTEIPF